MPIQVAKEKKINLVTKSISIEKESSKEERKLFYLRLKRIK